MRPSLPLIATLAAGVLIALGGYFIYFYGQNKYKECQNDIRELQATDTIKAVTDARADQEATKRAARAYSNSDLDDRLDDLGVLRK